jgi:hypothetical protein
MRGGGSTEERLSEPPIRGSSFPARHTEVVAMQEQYHHSVRGYLERQTSHLKLLPDHVGARSAR